MTIDTLVSRPAMPGFFGAVRELPAPADDASAVAIVRGTAPVAHTAASDIPSLEVVIKETARRVASDVRDDGRELSPAMVARAGLAWGVSLRSLAIKGDDGKPQVLQSHKAVQRDDTREVLDVVGKGYRVIQNAEAFAPFDDLVAEGGAEYVGAGSFDDGRIVYAQAKLRFSAEVIPGDMVRGMTLLSNGHGGSRAYRCTQTMVRVVCLNTLMMALRTGDNVFRIKHTRNARARVEEAQAQLRAMFARAHREVELYRALAARQMTGAQLRDYVHAMLPMPEDADAKRAAENVRRLRAEVLELADGGRGTEIPGVRGSLWGAYNAVTEHVDHVRARRGDSESRLKSIWYGAGAEFKLRALEEASKLIK